MNRITTWISLVILLIPSVANTAPPESKPLWTEFEASFHAFEGKQPVVTVRWWSMDSSGPFQEYPEIWRKGMRFGYGDRLRVVSLLGTNQDGIKINGRDVVVVIEDTKANKTFSFRSDQNITYQSYTDEWMKSRLLKYPNKQHEDK